MSLGVFDVLASNDRFFEMIEEAAQARLIRVSRRQAALQLAVAPQLTEQVEELDSRTPPLEVMAVLQ